MKDVSLSKLHAEVRDSKNDVPVMAAFYPENSRMAEAASPILQEIENEAGDDLAVRHVNASYRAGWLSPARFPVKDVDVPVLCLFKNGHCVGTKFGLGSKTDSQNWINDSLQTRV
jgi:thioredoxin-like negative regulator of GroEL